MRRGLCILALGAWLALSAQATKPVEQRSGRQESAQNRNQRPADNRAIAESLGRLASAVEAQNNDPYAAEDRQRAKDDLAAQQGMALWTQVMGWAGVVAVILSTVGIVLIYVTFQETRRAANEARRSVNAFMDAERARIAIIKPHYVSQDGENPQWIAEIHVKNYGRSPCKIREVQWAGLDEVTWHEDFKHTGHAARTVDEVVAADAAAKYVTYINVPKKPYVGGQIIYDTQFKAGCRTYFLWRVGEPEDQGGYGPPTAKLHEQGGQGWPKDT